MKRLPSGKYQDYIYLGKDENGKEIRRYASANTPKQLERKLIELRRQYDRGEKSLRDMPFHELANSWLESKRNRNTTMKYYTSAKDRLVEAFGFRKVTQIKAMHIEQVLNKLPAATAKLVLVVAKQIFDLAERNEIIQANPCRRIKVAYSPTARTALLPGEIKQLVECPYLKDRDRLMVYLMLFCGLRIGEVLALRWQDLKNGQIHVHQIFDGASNAVVSRTKTPAGVRFVDIPDQVAALIPQTNSLDFIFKTNTGCVLSDVAARNRWKRIQFHMNIAAGGLGEINGGKYETKIWAIKNYTFHTLRHTCATLWALSGILPDRLQYLLGHESVQISYNLYTHTRNLKAVDYAAYFPRYGGQTEVHSYSNRD